MHHGFKFKYAIPAEADQHGFGKYKDYGGTMITPDGITIVMVHHEHTWRLPTFALPDTSSKELSHARVKQKRAALDTLHESAADDPGNVKLRASKQELDECIEMAEMIDAQPSEGIATF